MHTIEPDIDFCFYFFTGLTPLWESVNKQNLLNYYSLINSKFIIDIKSIVLGFILHVIKQVNLTVPRMENNMNSKGYHINYNFIDQEKETFFSHRRKYANVIYIYTAAN